MLKEQHERFINFPFLLKIRFSLFGKGVYALDAIAGRRAISNASSLNLQLCLSTVLGSLQQ